MNESASGGKLADIIDSLSKELFQDASFNSRNSVLDPYPQNAGVDFDADEEGGLRKEHADKLRHWAKYNPELLHLNPGVPTEATGFHPVFRVGRDGQLLIELVVQFAQKSETDFGGISLRGGSTAVIQANGRLRYIISKPLESAALGPSERRAAKERVDRQRAFVDTIDEYDTFHIWQNAGFQKTRIRRLMNLAALHGGITR